jgi:hypothetical protein
MIAGGGSTGGILAARLGKFKNLFGANRPAPLHKTKEK